MGKIEEFINLFVSKNTRTNYKCVLNKYFKFLGVDPDHYFSPDRNYENDITSYWQSLQNSPSKSIQMRIACVKSFLTENDIDIKDRVWRNISRRTKGGRPVTQDIVPTREVLKEILSHGTTKDRALFLTILSSGMRPDEALHLKFSDVDLKSTPAMISIPASVTKTKQSRITFMSSEAKEMIKAWLKERKTYIDSKELKYYKAKPNEELLFPFTYNTSVQMWNRLVKKAGQDMRDGKRRKIHIMSLRKFFRTYMPDAMNVDIVEALMGHEIGQTPSYRRYADNIEKLKKLYRDAEHQVLIFEKPMNQDDIEALQSQITSMQNQLIELMKGTQWYQNSIIEPTSELPIMNDKEALKEMDRQKEIIKEIKEETPEVWAKKQIWKAKVKNEKTNSRM